MELTTVIDVKTEFSHSNDGITVDHYEPGEHTVTARCAEVAIKQLKVATESKKTTAKTAKPKAE